MLVCCRNPGQSIVITSLNLQATLRRAVHGTAASEHVTALTKQSAYKVHGAPSSRTGMRGTQICAACA